MGSDGARHLKLVYDLRHGRSSYSEQLRKFLLRQRQDVTINWINSIVDVEQPPRQASVDRVQRIAGGHVLELRQQDPVWARTASLIASLRVKAA
jgi:hypothetical protein